MRQAQNLFMFDGDTCGERLLTMLLMFKEDFKQKLLLAGRSGGHGNYGANFGDEDIFKLGSSAKLLAVENNTMGVLRTGDSKHGRV